MSDNFLTPPEPRMPAASFATRRAHLLDEIRREGRRRGVHLRRPSFRAAGLAFVSAVVLFGGGVALADRTDLLGQQQREHDQAVARDSAAPKPAGPAAEIATGDGWSLIAWRSDRGICLDFAVPGNFASGCGFPVAGATTSPESQPHAIAGLLTRGLSADGGVGVGGLVSPAVHRVEVELADGTRVAAPLYDAPAKLATNLRFFAVNSREAASPERQVTALVAYNAGGKVLERLPLQSRQPGK